MADLENNNIAPPHTNSPKCYVVLSNIQSGSNVGSICRNALAFNVDEVIVVGRRNFRDKMRQADRGAKIRQKFVHFNSVAEAKNYLKVLICPKGNSSRWHVTYQYICSTHLINTSCQRTLSTHHVNLPFFISTHHLLPLPLFSLNTQTEKQATIVGIEILDTAVSLTSHPFTSSTAFMFGNEGGGLSPRQREACDLFVYIPQYATGGMASINVACASAVVLQVTP